MAQESLKNEINPGLFLEVVGKYVKKKVWMVSSSC